jgi:ABC-type oligopeptide transport system substrate-binding subunit
MLRLKPSRKLNMPIARQRRLAAAACLVLGAVHFGACGERQAPASPDQGRAPQLIRRGLGAEPDTLDPQLAEDNAALAIAADLHEGLARTGPDGSPLPGAAESWERSADGREYIFKLRSGLRWSDGQPLHAEHFAVALRSLIAPDTTAPFAGLYAAISGIEVLDDSRIRVALMRPLPQLPALLALPAATPRIAAADTTADSPGNGPFRLVERSVGEQLMLERNPYYWDAGNIALDGVKYLTVQSLETELKLYRTGELDITSEVPNTHVAALRVEHPTELLVTPYLAVYAYAVNMQRLGDPGVRIALAMAIDRERITRQVTGAGERPAFGWVPEGIPGYSPARYEWQSQPYGQTVVTARELWSSARSRGAAPSRITLCTDASENHHRTAVALADMWRTALAVDTAIVELEWGIYLDTRRAPGECDLLRLGWSADFVDPEAFADVFESTSPQNTLGYRSERYDSLLAQSRSVDATTERMRLLTAAEAQLLSDTPAIPVFFRVSKHLVSREVSGAHVNPLGQLPSRDLALRRR